MQEMDHHRLHRQANQTHQNAIHKHYSNLKVTCLTNNTNGKILKTENHKQPHET
jgi:hypothetical protein